MNLDDLTLDSATPLVGSTFVAAAALDGADVPLTLESARATGAPWKRDARAPFNLYFRGPANAPVLAQRTYELRHEQAGELSMFLVPVGRDASGVLYEAVFS